MTIENIPQHDPILAIYSRWIDLALAERRRKAARAAAETAVAAPGQGDRVIVNEEEPGQETCPSGN
ncbi:MAG: hypothetical protein KJ063_23880 [Anaerolineae bacterium]|nr:hypothetical protein [Anaerolineae bacterium]